jgi:anti-anti-sigma factor
LDRLEALAFMALLHEDRGVPVVTGYGELDIRSEFRFRSLLADAEDQTRRGPHLVVDLSNLTFMDSTGLGVLMGLRSGLVERGGDLWIVAPEGSGRRLLELTGLHKVLRTRPSSEAAVEEILQRAV